MRSLLFAICTVLLLAGCGATGGGVRDNAPHTPLDDGYQFGDAVGTVFQLQAHYCRNADPIVRATVLASLSKLGAGLPASGACASLVRLIPPVSLEDIDIQQAVEDQKRFQGVSDDRSHSPDPVD